MTAGYPPAVLRSKGKGKDEDEDESDGATVAVTSCVVTHVHVPTS